jgi:hypothetical protein
LRSYTAKGSGLRAQGSGFWVETPRVPAYLCPSPHVGLPRTPGVGELAAPAHCLQDGSVRGRGGDVPAPLAACGRRTGSARASRRDLGHHPDSHDVSARARTAAPRALRAAARVIPNLCARGLPHGVLRPGVGAAWPVAEFGRAVLVRACSSVGGLEGCAPVRRLPGHPLRPLVTRPPHPAPFKNSGRRV